jgi:hypothetical protein
MRCTSITALSAASSLSPSRRRLPLSRSTTSRISASTAASMACSKLAGWVVFCVIASPWNLLFRRVTAVALTASTRRRQCDGIVGHQAESGFCPHAFLAMWHQATAPRYERMQRRHRKYPSAFDPNGGTDSSAGDAAGLSPHDPQLPGIGLRESSNRPLLHRTTGRAGAGQLWSFEIHEGWRYG